jgi:O-antigen/teichoic acid export membrane protein
MLARFIALNIISRVWTALSSLIFLPLYVSLLGLDSFAIVALASVVAGVIAIFDLGMSNAILREIARQDINAQQRHAAYLTLRTIYSSLVVVITITAPFASTWIVSNFVSNSPLPDTILKICLMLVIIEAALQLFFRFLLSAMMGSDRQIAANLFNLCWSTLRNGFVLAPMLLLPELRLFFGWQLAVTLLGVCGAWVYVQLALFNHGPRSQGLFDIQAFVRLRSFTGGVFLISVVAAINTQLDKLVIGRALDIINLGYYSLAVTLCTGILVLPSAFAASIQPRLTGHY